MIEQPVKDFVQLMNKRAQPVNGHIVTPWLTATEWSSLTRWSERKTRYWLEKMVDRRYVVWRWHPKRHGWYATRQYAASWLSL